jgi:hypothetical protein
MKGITSVSREHFCLPETLSKIYHTTNTAYAEELVIMKAKY